MKKNQSGQALIELIIFLPLMFALYGMISGFANAIFGSINQQKITRSYFYFRVQGNSMIPKTSKQVALQEWDKFGMFFIGWMESFQQGNQPAAPCYKISIPLAPAGTDSCGVSYNAETTQFIRVGTAYGICGATFRVTPDGTSTFLIPDNAGSVFQELLDVNSCTITR